MRYENMTSFIVMDIVKEAQKYPNAIHFEIGQPDLAPSPKVKEALHEAINDNCFSYTESMGLLALRVKIKEHYIDFEDELVYKKNIEYIKKE